MHCLVRLQMNRFFYILIPALLVWADPINAETISALPPCVASESFHNCHGLAEFDNGTSYEGEFVNGKPHGKGAATYSKGGKYYGEFKNGLRDGDGIYFYPNGDKHSGKWNQGKREGRGIYTFADGKIKIGVWFDGKFSGSLKSDGSDPSESGTEINETCKTTAKLQLDSSGYNGKIEIQLRKGNRPGSKLISTDSVNTAGKKEFHGICPGKYFFAFATTDSPTISITSYFNITEMTAIAHMTVFLSRTKTSDGSEVKKISRKDL